MGLFSSKNKRDRAAEDSGRFYSKDDDAAIGERARAKRASNAGASAGAASPARRQASDPLLPEKKRARRRLVGAIALALAAAVGLPMLLDSGPKPLAGDIAIQIPSKDKAAALPVPAAPADAPDAASTSTPASTSASTQAPTPAPAAAPLAPAPHAKIVAAADSVDRGEEVIAPPPAPRPELRRPEPKPEPKPEHKEARAEHKDIPKPEHKDSRTDTRLAEKADKADKAEKADKPAKPHDDTARALAILEDQSGEPKPQAASPKSVLQVAAMSSAAKAAEVQARLRDAGISSYTEKAANGLIRVKVSFSKDDADKVRAKLARLGL